MSAWLPPLNSHANYFIRVDASDNIQIPPSELLQFTEIRRPIFVLKLTVSAVYRNPNPDPDQIIQGIPLIFLRILDVNTTIAIDRNPKTLLTSLTDDVLNANLVPFELQHCLCDWWAENVWMNSENLDVQEFYIKIFEYLCQFTKNPNNANRKIIPIKLTICKVVDVPRDEFFSWVSYYDERKLIPSIDVPRSEVELFEEKLTLMMYKPAPRVAVNELERLIYDDKENYNIGYAKSTCPICLEGFSNGISYLIRLPCLHVFHVGCGVWSLRVNHVCPLCRYPLPTQ